MSNAAASMMSEELAGSRSITALRVQSVSDAYAIRATRLLHGTFTRPSGPSLRFEYELEDAGRHRIPGSAAVNGSLLDAASTMAKALDSSARPFSTSNADALVAWGHGDFDKAVTLDPDFGAAWIALIEKLAAANQKDAAVQAADRALARGSLRSNDSRARIQLLDAALHNDPSGIRVALVMLTNVAPSDPTAFDRLAEVESRARRFEEAVKLYRSAMAVDPSNPDVLNKLGYAEALAGRLPRAREVLGQYAKLPGQAVNAYDSLGEVHFMQGRFKEAAEYFNKSYAANPNFLGGAAIRKAAYAEWLGGNLTGADASLAPVFAALQSRGDPSAEWREACWLYATGRRDQAIAKLRAVPPGSRNQQLIERQLALWNGQVQPPKDPALLKNLYDSAQPTSDGMVRTLYAKALAEAGRKSEAAALLKLWPLPEQGDPLLQSIVFPEFLALRKSLSIQ